MLGFFGYIAVNKYDVRCYNIIKGIGEILLKKIKSFMKTGGRREKKHLYQQTYISHIYYHISDAFYDNISKP